MLNKYNDLINMLIARGYNVSTFEELDNEYSAIVYNNSNIYANIYLENTLEIYIHNENDECIESRNYVNSKYAYNFIKKYLED